MTVQPANLGHASLAPFAVDRVGAARLCGVSPSQWDRWRADGRTPSPCVEECDAQGRPRLVRWYVEDIRRWIADGMGGLRRKTRKERTA